MNRTYLFNDIFKKSRIPVQTSRYVYERIVDQLALELKTKGAAEFRPLGMFYIRLHKATLRNDFHGNRVMMPSRKKIGFNPSKYAVEILGVHKPKVIRLGIFKTKGNKSWKKPENTSEHPEQTVTENKIKMEDTNNVGS